MADSGYDGSVKIDTRLDPKGFNAGVKKLAASALGALNAVLLPLLKAGDIAKGALSKVVSIGKSIAGVFKKLLLGALIVFALSIQKIFQSLRDSMAGVLNLQGNEQTKKDLEGIQHQFEELKAAVANAFLPLLTAAIPYIKMALSWLIELFNKAAMITAAFTGQKEALQIIQGSAQKIADANKKTEKAARGQLAAFDQINVLQKPQQTEVSDVPKVAAQLVPVTDDILAKVAAIKAEIAEWFADPEGKAKELGETVKKGFLDYVFWDNWKRFFAGIIEGMKQKWQEFTDFIFLDDWVAFFKARWNEIKHNGAQVWEFIKAVWSDMLPFFIITLNTIKAIWGNVFGTLASIAGNGVIAVIGVIQGLKQVFTGIIQFIRGVFTGEFQAAWMGVINVFSGIANLWKAIIKGVLNSIIDLINGGLQAITIGLNTVISGANVVSGFAGFEPIPAVPSIQIPRLATGAVIPGGSAFLAVLGDQKAGQTNIEAPADLIRQIVREEMGSSDMAADITLNLDGETIYRNQQRVSRRHGKNLITSGSVS